MQSAGQNTSFSTNKTLNIRGTLIDLSEPKIMGIINVTPDSFYEGSRADGEFDLLKKAEKMMHEGATFLDVGGYSSRPGAVDITEEEELTRTVKAIELINKEFPTAILSVDTFRSKVAKEAIKYGAAIINDISGGSIDSNMFATVASLQVPYILMHMKGTPQNMVSKATYENLILEINQYLSEKIFQLHQLGVKDIVVDPGFGFSKTIEHNFELLKKLELIRIHEKPLLVGLSRKSMIWKTLNTTPDQALNGTSALHMTALMKGVSIVRVHDVKEAAEIVKLFTHL